MSIFDWGKAAVEKRLENNFFSAMALSWPISNYKLLIVIFSEGSYGEKINFIEKLLYDGSKTNFYLHFFGLPILVGLFYVHVMPYLNGYFERALEKAKVFNEYRLLKITQKIPFDSDMQEAYFSEYELEKEKLKTEKDEFRNKFLAEATSRKTTERVAGEMIRGQVLRQFICETSETPDKYKILDRFLTGHLLPEESRSPEERFDPAQLDWLRGHPLLQKIKNFLSYYDRYGFNETPKNVYEYIDFSRIAQRSEIDMDEAQDFSMILLSLRIISSTGDLNSATYSMHIDEFISARRIWFAL